MCSKANSFQERWDRFNKWEIEYIKSLTIEEKLNQFCILFDFSKSMPKEKVQKASKEHLENLISIKKEFKKRSKSK